MMHKTRNKWIHLPTCKICDTCLLISELIFCNSRLVSKVSIGNYIKIEFWQLLFLRSLCKHCTLCQTKWILDNILANLSLFISNLNLFKFLTAYSESHDRNATHDKCLILKLFTHFQELNSHQSAHSLSVADSR